MTPQPFTTTDGKTARLKNPYSNTDPFETHSQAKIRVPMYNDFEDTVQHYPIYSDKPIEAAEFSGDLIKQGRYAYEDWEIIPNSEPRYYTETRQAVQPVPVKGEVKVETDIEQAAEKGWYDRFQTGNMQPSYDEGFMDGHTHALASSNLVELRECLEAFVDSCYKGCTKDELNQLRINAEKALKK